MPFEKEVTISCYAFPPANAGIDESCLAYVDEESQSWKCQDTSVAVSGSVDKPILSGNTNHLSTWSFVFNGEGNILGIDKPHS